VRPQPSTLRDCGSILNSEEDDFSRGGDSTDLAGSGEAVHYRHVDVEQNDVGLQLDDFVDRLLAILGIATDLKRMPIQKRANGRPRGKMVIDDEDSSWQISSDCTGQPRRVGAPSRAPYSQWAGLSVQ